MIPKTKLLICVPCYQSMPTGFVTTFLKLTARLTQESISHSIMIRSDSLLPRLRNHFASALLYSDCTALLSLDCDHTFEPDLILYMLAADKDLIAAGCCRRKTNYDRMFLGAHMGMSAPELHELTGDLIAPGSDTSAIINSPVDPVPVRTTGGAIMLTRRTVFERIRDANLAAEYSLPDCNDYPKFWDFYSPYVADSGECGPVYVAEDTALTEKARQAGIQTWLTTRYRTTHIGSGEWVFSPQTHRALQAKINGLGQ